MRRCETCGISPRAWGEIDRCWECQNLAARMFFVPRWRVILALWLRCWSVWFTLTRDEKQQCRKKFNRPVKQRWQWLFPPMPFAAPSQASP